MLKLDLWELRSDPKVWNKIQPHLAQMSLEAKLGLRYDQPSMVFPDDKPVVCLAGRGWGKTARIGFTYRDRFRKGMTNSIAHVVPSFADLEKNLLPPLIEQFPPNERPDLDKHYSWQDKILSFPTYNSKIKFYSARRPSSMRGPSHQMVVLDEYCHYDNPEEVWRAVLPTLRKGKTQWIVCSSTSTRPEVVDRLSTWRERAEKDELYLITGTAFDNPFLPASFEAELRAEFVEGSVAWLTEVLALILDEPPNAIFTRPMWEAARVYDAPLMERVIVAIDPALSVTATSDETGIIVLGISEGIAYILADYSGRLNPEQIHNALRMAVEIHHASAAVIEENAGKMWLQNTLKASESLGLRMEYVTATRSTGGKFMRIEPCSAWLKSGKVKILNQLENLELQSIHFTGEASKSVEDLRQHDDRVDAMAYGLHNLLFKKKVSVRIKRI